MLYSFVQDTYNAVHFFLLIYIYMQYSIKLDNIVQCSVIQYCKPYCAVHYVDTQLCAVLCTVVHCYTVL